MSATASSSSSTPKLTPVAPIRLVSCFYDSSPDSSPISSPISSPTSASPIPASPPPLPTSPHVSFLPDRSGVSFVEPTQQDESNLEKSIPTPDLDTTASEDRVDFKIVVGGSTRGADVLVEGSSYVYIKDGKPNKKGQQRWRCTVRNKHLSCTASVLQNGTIFTRGAHAHKCTQKDCALPTALIKSQLRNEGKSRPFASGATLVKEAIQQHLPANAPASTLPSVPALVKSTNYLRQKRRPNHPKDDKFKWVDGALPDNFLQKDFTVGTARHLIFYTTFILTLLSKAKTWYVDATFKAVQRPFKQLWTIHAFITQNQSTKQVPLMFVLMSRKSKDDYIAILRHIKDALPIISVTTVVMDFEAAVWNAFRSVFDPISIRGCSFHWSQALWRRIQDEGLAPTYRQRKNTSKYLRELMCLPFLPAEEIVQTFRDFQNLLLPTHPEALHKVVQYVEDNWINSNIWDPSCWSVFGRAVRTNNDTEGWHHHLNILCEKIGHNNINLYELIEVLHREAGLVCNQCQLVGEEKLKRYQRLKYQTYQERIFTIWDDYRQKKITPRKLLEEISQHHRPADIH